MVEKDKFKKLIECAEKYIEDNALNIINTIRGTKHKTCYALIKDKYQPLKTKEDFENLEPEDAKKFILKRACIQLQNYQAMPKAINYASYKKEAMDGEYDNDILEIFINEFNQDVYDIKDKKDEKDEKFKTYPLKLYEEFKTKLKFDEDKEIKNKKIEIEIPEEYKKVFKTIKDENGTIKKTYYNEAWFRYSRGLTDIIYYFKQENAFGEFKTMLNKISKNDKPDINSIKNELKKIYDNIYYLGETLAFDYAKELCCRNLIKPDVHMKEIFKKLFHCEYSEVAVLTKFYELYENYDEKDEKDPYYIDKILWLCCTGSFYEDGIEITNMTRRNFLKMDGIKNLFCD